MISKLAKTKCETLNRGARDDRSDRLPSYSPLIICIEFVQSNKRPVVARDEIGREGSEISFLVECMGTSPLLFL